MAKFDYKRPGDEKMLEGGGSGGGYSSKNKSKMFNDAGDVAAAPLAVAMGLLGIKKGMSDSNEKAKLGRDPRFVAENYSNEGRYKILKANSRAQYESEKEAGDPNALSLSFEQWKNLD